MTIKYYEEVEQRSDEWFELRCGVITASEVKHIMTPTGKIASNDKSRAHVWEIAGQIITGHVEPQYISDDMLRGLFDEGIAADIYNEHYAPVKNIGFITNDSNDRVKGYSPDGLVGDDGLIEIKSRKQKFQVETIVSNAVPKEHMLQLQAGLLVSEREWIDYISYCAGMPLFVKRVYPDAELQGAITEAIEGFYSEVDDKVKAFNISAENLVKTERIEMPSEEIVV